jgi:alpha-tubulin suppressor-like RCC1 family protein
MAVSATSGTSRSIVNRVLSALAIAVPVSGAGSALAGPTQTTLTGNPNSSVYGETVTFTARIDGTDPTGTVTFLDGNKALGNARLTAGDARASITAGNEHSCALTQDGAARCWGGNYYGQVGDGTSGTGTDRTVPVGVQGLSSGVAAIAAGSIHTCALTEAGAVRCWGENGGGQLGDGTTTNRSTPVAVSGLSSGVAAVGAGGVHTCALTVAGAVRCWGVNSDGQLGDGSTVGKTTPVAVSSLSAGIVAIAVGQAHTCALTKAGAVRCWGANYDGQLGDGTTNNRATPVAVSGLSSGVVAIMSGGHHTCAVTEAGAVWCWGKNQYGQLGDGTNNDRTTPVAVGALSAGVVAVTGGQSHTCALTEAGAVRCWGRNLYGALGNGSTVNSATPVEVSGLSSGVAAIAAGGFHACALTEAGALRCWGDNTDGDLGDGTGGPGVNSTTPVAVSGFGAGTVLLGKSKATFSTSSLSAGAHKITARYGGDAGNSASTSPALSHVVNKGGTDTTLKVKPKTPKDGKTARLKIKVTAVAPASGKPTGKAIVKDGRKKLGTIKVKNGKAGLRAGKLTAGKHKFNVTYKGDRTWEKSSASKKVKVK